jgi:hypothetical protein
MLPPATTCFLRRLETRLTALQGDHLNHYESMSQKRHEAKLQELRQERAMEIQRLNKLKIGLQVKLAADKAKTAEFRAA